MRTLLLSFGIFVSAIGCQETEVTTCFPLECGIPATVKYIGGSGHCEYGFELADGSILIPARRAYIIAPSKEADPIYYYQFVSGTKVRLGFELYQESANSCGTGRVGFIHCLTEISTPGL